MYNKIIHKLVASIPSFDEIEREHQHDVLNWIDSGAELCRLEKPASPPKHLVSYFILLDIAKQTLLLVDHKKALLWLPTGGHVEPGEHPADTAHRELNEELNVRLPLLQPDPLFLTVTETIGTTAGHVDVSLWYVFTADSSVTYDYDTDEFNEIRWFPISELPLERSDPHMKRFCQKLMTHLPLVNLQTLQSAVTHE